ncbi:D-amino acid aminotransferase [Comamonas serinivorans]|uniref:D-amino acid aminotransferase n=1 Tax=Comamonas serinivorans TaxID=1082851 RepID=A0A1Y0ESQ3_9BURK|nr:aminotransferase class IV [Comamonas serinivorans]ARU06548.1 D-amino acid aminotransferase [Comamonas serinivorans]
MTPVLPDLPCYLQGEYATIDQAKVSVMDRGFILGDGVYEVVPIYGSHPFCLPQHLARLGRSLATVQIPAPLGEAEWQGIIGELVARYRARPGCSEAEVPTASVYLQVTRGVALREHTIPAQVTPTVFAFANAMATPSTAQREQGVACVSADEFRWEKAHIKSTSLLGAVLARAISQEAGAAETILFRKGRDADGRQADQGFLSEASACNVWVVKDGAVYGPPKDNLVLEGIRFSVLEALCAKLNIPLTLRRIAQDEVFAADELLLSSASKEVLPVTRLDGQAIGNGVPGPIYQSLYAAYQDMKRAAAQGQTP